MPRNLDFQTELRAINQLIEEDQSTPRSYICRLPPPTALHLVRDCLDQNKQPGRRLGEIIQHYYSGWSDGVHMTLPKDIRESLDAVADIFSVDRETVVKLCIGHAIGHLLREAQDKAKEHKAEKQKLKEATRK